VGQFCTDINTPVEHGDEAPAEMLATDAAADDGADEPA